MNYQNYKGTEDRFGEKLFYWKWLEKEIREICRAFCFGEIKTPVFEYTEVFTRGVGETTDIVQKEMFTFSDRGGRSLTLKPELTAGVARAYVQHGMRQLPQPVKVFYIEPCFRAERPQKGRDIEFFQFGVEHLGSYEPSAEAEVMSVAFALMKRLGISGVRLRVNSLGCPSCREKYNAALREFIGRNIGGLCPVCRERFDRNALRVLDCKTPKCQDIIAGAPSALDVMEPDCREHFNGVLAALGGLGIEYETDPRLVRGLDYYTRTVFEFVPEGAGSQGTVCGGGRYDGLISGYGGEPAGAVGFGMGMGRLLDVLAEQNLLPEYRPGIDIYVGSAGKAGAGKAAALAFQLRREGVSAEYDTLGRSVKAQMKYAGKLNAGYALIIGGDEIAAGKAGLKNMATGEETEIGLCAGEIKRLTHDIDSGRRESAD